MAMLLRNPLYTIGVCAVLGCIPQAQAAAITNLTDKPVQVALKTGNGYEPITIEAGRTWRLTTQATLRFGERELLIGTQEEYAIWKDGTFGPQRPNARRGTMY